jgi:hypothetical protein
MDGTDMNRVFVIVAFGLALAGCTSGGNSFSLFEPRPVEVVFQSTPPGAEAKTTTGQSCQTPCTLPMPPDKDFQVTYTLAGYAPQTLSVQPANNEETFEASLQPNPVAAELVAMPKGPAKRTPAKKKPAAKPAARAAASKPVPASAAPPPPMTTSTTPAPAPASADPWPPVR